MSKLSLAALAVLSGLSACAPASPPLLVEAPPPVFERRILLTVNFDFDSYRIRPESYAGLDNVATAFGDPQLAGLQYEINGHTDVSGRLGYNVSLSLLRAGAVRDYLAARGVPRDRMRTQGFGPLQPLDPYNPRSPVNRRVELVAYR